MFNHILSLIKENELNGFSFQLKQFNKKVVAKSTSPHTLIHLASDIVITVITSNPNSQVVFDQANKKLWLIAKAIDEQLNTYGFNCNEQDINGNTLFHCLALLCQAACNEGPGLSSWDNLDKKPGYENFTLSEPIAHIFVRLLVNTDVNLQNKNGDTVLHILATATERQLGFNAPNFLLSKDAKTDLKNNNGYTCISIAEHHSMEADLLNQLNLFGMNQMAWRKIASDNITDILQTKEKFLMGSGETCAPGPSPGGTSPSFFCH